MKATGISVIQGPSLGKFWAFFQLPVAQLSTPIAKDARCISEKGALVPYKKDGMVFPTLLHSHHTDCR